MAVSRRAATRLGALALVLLAVPAAWGRPLAFALVRRAIAWRYPDVQWTSGAELAAKAANPPLLLDARSPEEFATSHLPGARRVSQGAPDLPELAALPRDKEIVVYCSVGLRSASVVDALGRRGFTNVRNLAGSAFQWANQDRPLESAAGPTRLVHPYDWTVAWLVKPEHRAR